MLAIYAEMYNQIIIDLMQKFVSLHRQNWGGNVLVEYFAISGSEIRLAHKCHWTCMASPLILYGIFDFEKLVKTFKFLECFMHVWAKYRTDKTSEYLKSAAPV